MKVDIETLLDELVRRHARGEPLDVEAALARAGDHADELATLIEAYLERAPRNAPSTEAMELVRSLDDPPMLRARVGKRLRVDDVVDAIVTACDVQPEKRPKVRRYYQQLEAGVLDPSRVAAKVWDAITALLERPRAALVLPRLDAPSAPAAYLRTEAPYDVQLTERLVTRASEPVDRDEVDALFLGNG